jgi:signal transduction histidine kinase
MVFADVSLVERALQNLIENAIKFTEPGGKVVLSLKRKDRNVEINITDTGSGIPLSEQPYIFDRFKQVGNSTKKQGSGLGLAIVKKIMDLHDTTITVLSKPRKGSSFIFNLPAYQV